MGWTEYVGVAMRESSLQKKMSYYLSDDMNVRARPILGVLNRLVFLMQIIAQYCSILLLYYHHFLILQQFVSRSPPDNHIFLEFLVLWIKTFR